MAVIPQNHVWVFNGGRQFPGGVFTTVERAEEWIGIHRLTGTLTAYPVDEGCFDWAVREGCANLKPETLAVKRDDPAFIASFSTASQEHYHYAVGKRA